MGTATSSDTGPDTDISPIISPHISPHISPQIEMFAKRAICTVYQLLFGHIILGILQRIGLIFPLLEVKSLHFINNFRSLFKSVGDV